MNYAEKQLPEIKHSFDVWHGATNFGKKIIKVSLYIFISV
jgi:hypothetical protein